MPLTKARSVQHSTSMNTPSITSPQVGAPNNDQYSEASDRYSSSTRSQALIRSGAQFRRDRIKAADMITTHQAAKLAGTSGVTIDAWVKAGRCIGVSHLRGGFKLPSWQFEAGIWPLLQPLAKCLGTNDGWQLLSFLETPSAALDGLTPRMALEQGIRGDRILVLAAAEAH